MRFVIALLGGTAALAFAGPASAQNSGDRIEALQRQMEEMQRAFEQQQQSMQSEIEQLRAR
jgi:type II secretory pathway pseudopilin PulG